MMANGGADAGDRLSLNTSDRGHTSRPLGAVFGTPKTGTIDGFIFALLAIFTWPWLMPKFIDHWLDDGDNQPS